MDWDWKDDKQALSLFSQYLGKLEAVNPNQPIINEFGARALTLRDMNLPQDSNVITNLEFFDRLLGNRPDVADVRYTEPAWVDVPVKNGMVQPPQVKLHEIYSSNSSNSQEKDSFMLLGYQNPNRLAHRQVGAPPEVLPAPVTPVAKTTWEQVQAWLPFVGIGLAAVGGLYVWSSSSQAERVRQTRYTQEKKSIEALFDKGLSTFAKLESIDSPDGGSGTIYYSQRANTDIGRIPSEVSFGNSTYQLKLLSK